MTFWISYHYHSLCFSLTILRLAELTNWNWAWQQVVPKNMLYCLIHCSCNMHHRIFVPCAFQINHPYQSWNTTNQQSKEEEVIVIADNDYLYMRIFQASSCWLFTSQKFCPTVTPIRCPHWRCPVMVWCYAGKEVQSLSPRYLIVLVNSASKQKQDKTRD